MAPGFPNPSMMSFFGNVSVGAVYARSLLTAFAFQALAFTVYQMRRMRRELYFLGEAARVRRLQNAGGNAVQDRQKTDVWTDDKAAR